MSKPDPSFDTQIYNSLRELDKKYSYFHFKNILNLKNFDKESLPIFCKASYFCLQMKNIKDEEFFICTNILNNSYEDNKKFRFRDYRNINREMNELIAFWITKAFELLEHEKKIEQKDYSDLNIFNVSLKKNMNNFLSKLIPVCTNFLFLLKDKALIEFYKIIYKSPEIIKNDLMKRFKNINDLIIQNQIKKLINKRQNDSEIDNVLFGLILSYIVPKSVSQKIIDFLFKNLNLLCFINFNSSRIILILKNKDIDLEFKTYLLENKIKPKFYARKKIFDFIIQFDHFNSLQFRKKDIKFVFDAIRNFVVQNNNPPLENSRTNYENNYKKNETCIKDSLNKSNIDNEGNKKDINIINESMNNSSIQNNEENEILFFKKAFILIKKTLWDIDIVSMLEGKISHKYFFTFINEVFFDVDFTLRYLKRNFRNTNSNMKEYFLYFQIEDDRVKEVESYENINDENLLCLKVTDEFQIPGFIFENLSLSNFIELLNHLSPRIILITQNRSIFEYNNDYLLNILDKKCFKDTYKDESYFIKYPDEIKNENEIIKCIRYVLDVYEFLSGFKIHKQIKYKFKIIKMKFYPFEDTLTIKNFEYKKYTDHFFSILRGIWWIILENVKSQFILNKNNEEDCLIHKNCILKNFISTLYKKNKSLIFFDGFIENICIFCIPLFILKRYKKYIRIYDRISIIGQFNILNKILIFKKMNKNVEILEKIEIFTLFLNLKGFYSLEVLKKMYHKVNNNKEYNNDFIELLKEIYFLIENAQKLNFSDNEDKYISFLSEIDKVNENIILMRKRINQEYKICKNEKLNLNPFFDEKLIRVLRLNNSLQENDNISDDDQKYIFEHNTKKYKLFQNSENEFNYEEFKELIYNHYVKHHKNQNLLGNDKKFSCKLFDSFLNTPFEKKIFFQTLLLITDTNFHEFISKYDYEDLGLFKKAFQTIYSENNPLKVSLCEKEIFNEIDDQIFFDTNYQIVIIKKELNFYFSYLIEDIASKKYQNMKINLKKQISSYDLDIKYFIKEESCDLKMEIWSCPFKIKLDFRECWLKEEYKRILQDKSLAELIGTYELFCINYLDDVKECLICLYVFESGELPMECKCRALYHKICALKVGLKCPFCRVERVQFH